MIPLTGCDPRVDQNSPYGLAFTLREDAELITAPILNESGLFTSADVDEQTGLPRRVGKEGDRRLWTCDGLSRLYLNRDLGLESGDDNLADSDSVGRVVVVRRGAAAQNFEAMIRQEYDRQRERFEERYKKALATLINEKE